MSITLRDPKVSTTLARLFAASEEQFRRFRSDPDDPGVVALRSVVGNSDVSVQERSAAAAEIYMPVTPGTGELLYSLVRATRPAVVVEFGMSFGISAVHLAAAVRDNGSGRVVTTEIADSKIAAAKATFAETGLADVITVLEGDALETLASLDGPVDFVLLDGWKDLYLPVIKLLEPKLSPGALVLADNTEHASGRPYLDYIRDPANGYASSNFVVRGEDGIEISCRAE